MFSEEEEGRSKMWFASLLKLTMSLDWGDKYQDDSDHVIFSLFQWLFSN